jgi:hypothetical protein
VAFCIAFKTAVHITKTPKAYVPPFHILVIFNEKIYVRLEYVCSIYTLLSSSAALLAVLAVPPLSPTFSSFLAATKKYSSSVHYRKFQLLHCFNLVHSYTSSINFHLRFEDGVGILWYNANAPVTYSYSHGAPMCYVTFLT